MSILTDVYKIPETDGKLNTIITNDDGTTGAVKYFHLNLENISKEQNDNSSVFWNFGDPGTDNELICQSVVNSSAQHTYQYNGNYNIHCIVNIAGVTFHLEQNFQAGSNDVILITDQTTKQFLTKDNLSFTFKSFFNTDVIYYTIVEDYTNTLSPLIDSEDKILYTGSTIPLTVDDGDEKVFTINFCGYEHGSLIQLHSETFVIDKLHPTMVWQD